MELRVLRFPAVEPFIAWLVVRSIKIVRYAAMNDGNTVRVDRIMLDDVLLDRLRDGDDLLAARHDP